MATAIQALEHYDAAFAGLEKSASGDAAWLRDLRRRGFAQFSEKGFPTLRDEDWRFTNIAPIANASFQLVRNGHHLPARQAIEPYRIAGAACELIFVDGRFALTLSSLGELPRGVTVASLAAQLVRDPASVETHLGRYLDTGRDAFAALLNPRG